MNEMAPNELGSLFEVADVLQAEYLALHEEFHPAVVRATLMHIGVAQKPDWPALNARLHRLEAMGLAEFAKVELALEGEKSKNGTIPRVVNLRYLLFVAALNCVRTLKLMRETIESGGATIQTLASQQRHYRDLRAKALQASQNYWSAAHD